MNNEQTMNPPISICIKFAFLDDSVSSTSVLYQVPINSRNKDK